MKLRLFTIALVFSLLMGGFAAPMSAQAQTPAATVPVTGTYTDALGGVGNFVGTFGITSFARQGANLVANGVLQGTLTDSLGNVTNVTQNVALPVANITGSCPILHLELGPLDLNLLGLQVHLDQVVLDITAQSGAGNLLGNVLCAVANLLNGNAPLGSLANLLNQILGLLG